MTTAWAHLPNAAHIDRILADVKARPDVWDAAWDAACGAAFDAACDAACGAACGAACDAARGAAFDAARGAAWGAARGAARDAICALVAWDDCAELLDLEPDALRLLVACDHHAAILLLSAGIALNSKETT